jgi:hypothetical protein
MLSNNFHMQRYNWKGIFNYFFVELWDELNQGIRLPLRVGRGIL